jgi:signal transduction histidine kinase
METELRKTGIKIVGDMPWGTHFCHFYETKDDLFDILIPYFKTGLENNELCLWIVFEPLDEKEAKNALRQAIPEVAQHLAAGDIQILPHEQWYLKDDTFDSQWVINGWQEKLNHALSRGYAGMRANGIEGWLTKKDWKYFSEYEKELNNLIANQKMIVLCTYPLEKSSAAEIFDVARLHQFISALRYGDQEILGTPALKQAKAEIKRLNEALTELKLVEEQLKSSNKNLRALAARLQAVREEESIRIARKIHDELGSALTGLKMDVSWLNKRLTEQDNKELQQKSKAMSELIDETIQKVRNISIELRPSILDDLGLAAAIEGQCREFQKRTEIKCRIITLSEETELSPDKATAVFRIFQEILTNVARHSRATLIEISMKQIDGDLVLKVSDNGEGIKGINISDTKSLGILGMHERAVVFGGHIEITGEEGKGTTVTVRIPRE